ncbi:MAG: VWA domain-containing protein [Puniceicoccaceae bacterium]
MSVMNLQFQHPWWLLATLPVAVAVFLIFRWGNLRRRASLDILLHRGLHQRFTQQVSVRMRRLKQGILLISVVLIVFALARPQLGYNWEESPLETTDLLIALDTSRSMLAPDLKPNRLARAKLEIETFVRQLTGVRIGLIPFAGDAFLWCPLTYDTETFLDTLRNVDVGIIPTGGTNLLSAVDTAERSFLGEAGGTKIMVLITDGENLQGQIDERLPAFSRKRWVIHTIGIGTEEGELIPIQREDGSTSFVTDAEGNVVKSKLDSHTLSTIAQQTGGTYHALGQGGQGLYDLFNNVLREQLEAKEESRLRKIPIERYAWVVALLLALLTTELLLRDRRNKFRRQSNTMLLLLSLMMLTPAFEPHSLSASPARDAQKAYSRGDFVTAEQLYQEAVQNDPGRLKMQYNLGVSALRNENFSVAKQAFDNALQSSDLDLQQSAYYNRANTLYQLGRAELDTKPQHTVEHWEKAVQDYERALALNSEDFDAQANKSEVERLLEQLKELLKQQNPPQDSDGSENSENSDENQNSESDSSDSSQDQQSGENSGESSPSDSSDSGESSANESSGDQQDSSESQPSQSPQDPSEPEDSASQSEPDQQDSAGQEPDANTGESQGDTPQGAESAPSESEPQPSPSASQASPSGGDEQENPRETEALRLLESLKNEDGDAPQLLFRMQNPEAEEESPEMDW